MTSHTPSPVYQIENQSHFLSEHGLPASAVNKLTTAEPGDHVKIFKGNVDDNFRVRVKMTRQSVKMFSDFYDSDAIIASPLLFPIAIHFGNTITTRISFATWFPHPHKCKSLDVIFADYHLHDLLRMPDKKFSYIDVLHLSYVHEENNRETALSLDLHKLSNIITSRSKPVLLRVHGTA